MNRIGWLNRRFGLQQTRNFIASAHEILEQTESSKLTELSNGLKVASYNNGRPTSVVGVWVDSGSSYEPRETNGAAKFFQHLICRGTGKRTAQQLESDLGKLGARLSTRLDRDHTAYYVTCLTRDADKVVEILVDVLKNSKLDEKTVEAERDILLKNLEEAEADYPLATMDMLHATAFQGTGYENSPLGNTDAIKSITREQIANFVHDQFKPVRMVFTGVGGVEHAQVEEWAGKHFGSLDNHYHRKIPLPGGVRFTGSEFRYRNDNIPLMYGAFGVEGVRRGHPDEYALKVANEAVGEWDRTHTTSFNSANRLAQRLCTEHELLGFENFSLNYTKTGLWGVRWVMHGHDLFDTQRVADSLLKEWKYLATGVQEEDVDRAKATLRVRLFQTLEENAGIAHHIATEALGSGHITPLADVWRKIDRIDASKMREALSRHIYDREIATAGFGATEAFPIWQKLRAGMSWWRL